MRLFLLLFVFSLGLAPALRANAVPPKALPAIDSIPVQLPKGLHEVGHTSYSIKEGGREMVIQFWYPAEIMEDNKKAAPILDKTHFSSLLDKQAISASSKKSAKDIKKAILNEEDLGFPVMVFFSEFGLERLFTMALYKKLASNGFVVVSIDLPELGVAMVGA